MIDPEIKIEILKILYDTYFDEYQGIYDGHLYQKVHRNKNDVSKATGRLMIEGTIEKYDSHYHITAYGIDLYEKELPTSIVGKRFEQRETILKLLKESYDEDTQQYVNRSAILDKIKNNNKFELMAQMGYLKRHGWIELCEMVSSNFRALLLAEGYQFLEQKENT